LALDSQPVLVVILLERVAQDFALDSAGVEIIGLLIPRRILVHEWMRHVLHGAPGSHDGRDGDAELALLSRDVVLRLRERHLIDGPEDAVAPDLESLIGLTLYVLGEKLHKKGVVIG